MELPVSNMLSHNNYGNSHSLVDIEPLVVPSNTKVVQSKWELVDYGKGSSSENEEESLNTVGKKDKLPSSKCDVKATDSDEEKKRQMLRDVEVIV